MELKLEISNFEEFLKEDYLIGNDNKQEFLKRKIKERNNILLDFSHSIILKLSYHQLDFANWLLWQILGEVYGYCGYSNFPMCKIKGEHKHNGIWAIYWLAKTNYDYGFNEWFFKQKEDSDVLIKIKPLLEQLTCFGIYDDKYFVDFLDELVDKTKSLSKDEKIDYFKNIDWEDVENELLNETYNFKNGNE